MKIITWIIIIFLIVGFADFNDDEIKTSGNILLNEAKSIRLLINPTCDQLINAENYLITYQQLHDKYKTVLIDKSATLIDIQNQLKDKNCFAENSGGGYGTVYSAPMSRLTIVMGGGGYGGSKKELPAYFVATYYMDKSAKEAYLRTLPQGLQDEYTNLKNDLNDNYKDIDENISKKAAIIKVQDNKNNIDKYFQNSSNELLKNFNKENIEKLKKDLKKATEFSK